MNTLRSTLYSLAHDGPLPLTLRGPRPGRGPTLAAFFEKGGSSSSASQSTSSKQVGQDGSGNLQVSDVSGGLSITGVDPETTQAVLDTAAGLGTAALDAGVSLGGDALDTARKGLATVVDLNSQNADTTLALAQGVGDAFKNFTDSARKLSADAIGLATSATETAAHGASEVANSQSKFLATQTGQDSLVQILKLGALAGVGLVAIGGLALVLNKKSQ